MESSDSSRFQWSALLASPGLCIDLLPRGTARVVTRYGRDVAVFRRLKIGEKVDGRRMTTIEVMDAGRELRDILDTGPIVVTRWETDEAVIRRVG